MSTDEPNDPSWALAFSEGSDRRARRTKKALMDALLELLREKSLTAITVTELAKRADVNRATFYTHYQDVYDMYDHLIEALCSICRSIVDAHGSELAAGSYLGLIEDIYQFVDDNELVFNMALSDNSLFSAIIPVVREACMKNANVVKGAYAQLNAGKDADATLRQTCQTVCNYQFDYIAGGVVNILRSWLAQGRKESVHRIALITDSCIHSLNPDGHFRITANTVRSLGE